MDKAKAKGQKDKIGINDIGIFEFIFRGLPEPPELEGIDEENYKMPYRNNYAKETKKEREI